MLIRTEDKMVTYGRNISNYLDPGAHPDTYAIKNLSYSFTNGVVHTLIAGLFGLIENLILAEVHYCLEYWKD